MHILKAVKKVDGVKRSKVYECRHYTVDELPEFFSIEFPERADDGTWPITTIKLPDDYDAIYHMSPITGDTLDSWTWDEDKGRALKVNHNAKL